jgi:hypothetical protein
MAYEEEVPRVWLAVHMTMRCEGVFGTASPPWEHVSNIV